MIPVLFMAVRLPGKGNDGLICLFGIEALCCCDFVPPPS
jgi:hypothetical protein